MNIIIDKVNEVYCRITGDFEAVELLAEHFTFEVPEGRFSPKHVSNGGTWDGSIRLLNRMNGLLYGGLVARAVVMAHQLGIKVDIDPEYKPRSVDCEEAIAEMIDDLGLEFDPYDFQIEAVKQTAERKRLIITAATSSGKTMIVYLIFRFLQKKTLVISPRVGLVNQMVTDLRDYGYQDGIHTITAGSDKNTTDLLTISTWQSIKDMPRKWFEQFNVIIGDEVHLFESKCLTSIMEKTVNAEYKIGLTGSLKGTKTHELVLTGLFGPVHKSITTREMIDRKISSDVEIIVIVFVHNAETQKLLPFRHSFQKEDAVIIQNKKRNKYIAKLVESLKGNSLVVFRKIEKHGEILKQLLEETGKPVHYIHGTVKGDKREEIRQMMEKVDNEILLASSGTSSTGISIKNLQNLVQTNSIKSRIDLLQTLGRGLRKDGKANHLRMFDLADKFKRTGDKTNSNGYSYRHLLERLKIYQEQQLPYKLIEINL